MVQTVLEPNQVLSKQHKRLNLNCHGRTDVPSVPFLISSLFCHLNYHVTTWSVLFETAETKCIKLKITHHILS
jgi:hypothetical protein